MDEDGVVISSLLEDDSVEGSICPLSAEKLFLMT